MPAVEITPADLAPFAEIDETKAQAMIDDAMARAALVAPCIVAEDFALTAAAKAIIRAAVLRWHDLGSGAVKTQTVGPFGQTVDGTSVRKGMFLLSEVEELKGLCGSASTGKAFQITTAAGSGPVHADVCSLNLGAAYCSCGADLTQAWPLYEVDG